jgi:hypothetical protein
MNQKEVCIIFCVGEWVVKFKFSLRNFHWPFRDLIIRYTACRSHNHAVWATPTALNTGRELRCCGRIVHPAPLVASSFYSCLEFTDTPYTCEDAAIKIRRGASNSRFLIYFTKLLNHLMWLSRVCASYPNLLDRALLLIMKLLNHGFLVVKFNETKLKCL